MILWSTFHFWLCIWGQSIMYVVSFQTIISFVSYSGYQYSIHLALKDTPNVHKWLKHLSFKSGLNKNLDVHFFVRTLVKLSDLLCAIIFVISIFISLFALVILETSVAQLPHFIRTAIGLMLLCLPIGSELSICYRPITDCPSCWSCKCKGGGARYVKALVGFKTGPL